MSDKINSSSIAAEGAINELVGIDTSGFNNQTVEISFSSGISGMVVAKDTVNNVLDAISDFASVVLEQANKFPEIAHKIEKRDIEDKNRWVK
ncbi:MAG: TIGR04197 family type VII secretion effector [Lachnospiraceae bacterium]|nr:TIGR04197 family type VII secretion effector [Lachnospiraceae bacterium]